ncbi:MAG TPA: carboxyl transferase domain-containing protein [Candidatus Binatia bacterium]|jgi:acetyl/propionyl-CoA carboxylase alpha subunit/acetyl-CoA carboxylase carboxyltransferase component
MPVTRILVANRGEIAIRIFRAASTLGMETVAVFAEDDAACLHVRRADVSIPLRGSGPAAYLDAAQIVAAARDARCDAVHPGYGFLAERPSFAQRCIEAGLTFVGPTPELLELLGDKARARTVAERCGVPTLPGTPGAASLTEAAGFFAAQPDGAAVVLKAIAGGGGRGMRVVQDRAGLTEAWTRCRSEAESAFGNGELFVERFLPRARHVEVQIVGDRAGHVRHLWERECTLQRRHQKLVEMAPSPALPSDVRERLLAAALRMATEVRYEGLGTFEFLLDADALDGPGAADDGWFFIEANPRLQVEHTVTEEVTGVDLVQVQLRLAAGATLAELGLADPPPPRGLALQLRVNMERMQADGGTVPSGGTLAVFEPPTGPGVRVDTLGYAGYTTSPRYDSLLAKIVVRSPSAALADLLPRAARALGELRIEGVATNAGFLEALLVHPAVARNAVDTRFVETHAAELLAAAAEPRAAAEAEATTRRSGPGARVDPIDPLAVLEHGKTSGGPGERAPVVHDDAPGTVSVRAPMQGTIVAVDVRAGDAVRPGATIAVLEAMKMEHVVASERGGRVRGVAIARGDTVFEGDVLATIEEGEIAGAATASAASADLGAVRPDLAEVVERHTVGLDVARPEAVARRRKTGQRTARENVNDLCDPGTFVEYAPLVVAAQRQRRAVEDLIKSTPADGLVAGVARVNGSRFPGAPTRCVVLAYDYTVLAGTQGAQNHRKKDRMLELAERRRLPVVLFSEGGGGRPGDTDALGIAGLDVPTFQAFARLSALVPLVGINSGFCFAGNAALLGCCDVVIATANSNIGMGGPAMVEGGGLGVFRPEEIGPMSVQVRNGVVDVAVADEAEGVAVAKRYLGYFQGADMAWECADQRTLRGLVPENRLRVYEVRSVIEALADTGSVLELRRGFGHGMVTALARIEGRPLGIVANNPTHLAGAIDADGADKAARFLQLCDAFDLPVVFLCDTPGIMVGPEIEKRAHVRHAARMFVVGGSLTVPFCTIVLRKGYGLGAMAMAGGSFKAPLFTVAWPTGEFGGMGLEGAVKLGFRKELAAVTDAQERRALFDQMVERMYRHGKAVSAASHFEIDDVIDPADSRRWIGSAIASAPVAPRRRRKKRPCIDPW